MKSYKVQLIAFFYFEVHLRAASVDQQSEFRSALHTQGLFDSKGGTEGRQ